MRRYVLSANTHRTAGSYDATRDSLLTQMQVLEAGADSQRRSFRVPGAAGDETAVAAVQPPPRAAQFAEALAGGLAEVDGFAHRRFAAGR